MLQIKSHQDFQITPGWLEKAIDLPGNSVSRMAIVVLQTAQARGKKAAVIRQSELDKIGFNRISAYKALNQLRDAGLIRLHRRRRNSPIVQILDSTE